MKIYLLSVNPAARPSRQVVIYPSHNNDYGVEQDFFDYLQSHPDLLVNKPEDADWHYLPIYWTRWHVNHSYGKEGLKELQGYVDNALLRPKKTFTVCQYDDGPVTNLFGTKEFLASRKTLGGIDIPLISKPHKIPWYTPRKKHRASFVGRLATHPVRTAMANHVLHNDKYIVIDGDIGTGKYVSLMLQSYVALCPRGYGGSSFRFYEAMQLGLVPFLIGDRDTRPFKDQLPWGEFSLYTDNPAKIESIISQYSEQQLLKMGQIAKKIWNEALTYQKWCNLALKELE